MSDGFSVLLYRQGLEHFRFARTFILRTKADLFMITSVSDNYQYLLLF
jgi:hypothetical protein